MRFFKCIHLCNHSVQDLEHFHHLPTFHAPLYTVCSSPYYIQPLGNYSSAFSHCRLDYLFQDLLYEELQIGILLGLALFNEYNVFNIYPCCWLVSVIHSVLLPKSILCDTTIYVFIYLLCLVCSQCLALMIIAVINIMYKPYCISLG